MANSIKDRVCSHIFKAGLRKKYLSGRPCWIWSWPQGWVHTRRAWTLSSWPPHIGHAVCVDHISPRGLHSVPRSTKEQKSKFQFTILLQSGMECLRYQFIRQLSGITFNIIFKIYLLLKKIHSRNLNLVKDTLRYQCG